MIEVACRCGDLPAHDHFLGHELREGVYGPRWGRGPDEVGRVWVDWKAVARAVGAALSSRGALPGEH